LRGVAKIVAARLEESSRIRDGRDMENQRTSDVGKGIADSGSANVRAEKDETRTRTKKREQEKEHTRFASS
jgi:hypothetical protein